MAGLASSVKHAFTWRWNLLALAGAVGFSFLSGRPDILLPAVAAIELAYLGFVGTNASFQRYLGTKDILDSAKALERDKVDEILSFISKKDRERYLALRQRCKDVAELRQQIDVTSRDGMMDGERKASTEQLLWIFLRLLHRKNGVEKLLDSTDEDRLDEQLEDTQEQIQKQKGNPRLLSSLEQKLKTLEARLHNYRKSYENLQLIKIELDRTEIQLGLIVDGSTSESNPESLSSQVKEIASTVATGEQIIQDVYGDFYLPEDPPALLDEALDSHREWERE